MRLAVAARLAVTQALGHLPAARDAAQGLAAGRDYCGLLLAVHRRTTCAAGAVGLVRVRAVTTSWVAWGSGAHGLARVIASGAVT